MSDNNTEENKSNNGCAIGCLGFISLIFSTHIGAIAGFTAIKKQSDREEKICEINPNCNDIVGFTRTVNYGIVVFFGVTVLSTIICAMAIWFLFKEDKKSN